MASDMVLYWGSGSPPCWRVQVVLEEKKLQGYKSKLLSFEKGEHKSAEVLALNPRGQLPTFKDGTTVINESLGICLYLENKYKTKGTQLICDDPKEYAAVYQKILESNNIIQRIGDIMQYSRRVPESERTEAGLQRLMEALSEELKFWEGYVQKMGAGSHIAVKNFTMADAVIFPIIAALFRFGVSQDKYPNLAKYYNSVKSRPSIQATWPPHWKENPDAVMDMLKNV
ncbi:glutathione S-transferase A-like [Protopterus annectens]|uniref:glutathione S-transferase A-like n=1 Tax=Protopterus annectens TaxID=7888 RepID=UPI001CF952BA|nr:glutathione S-transferase A-like [Protopterus annectens]